MSCEKNSFGDLYCASRVTPGEKFSPLLYKYRINPARSWHRPNSCKTSIYNFISPCSARVVIAQHRGVGLANEKQQFPSPEKLDGCLYSGKVKSVDEQIRGDFSNAWKLQNVFDAKRKLGAREIYDFPFTITRNSNTLKFLLTRWLPFEIHFNYFLSGFCQSHSLISPRRSFVALWSH